jgi:hypothetical protein
MTVELGQIRQIEEYIMDFIEHMYYTTNGYVEVRGVFAYCRLTCQKSNCSVQFSETGARFHRT